MAKKKMGGLGKGLDSLFADLSDDTGSEASNSTLPLREIEPDPEQPRKRFDDDALNQLADSITENGLLQPIAVRPKKVGPGYIIIAGERRWRAARLAGLDEVPVIIKDVTDEQAAALALIENLQREDLDPIEEAEGYRTLMEQYDMTQEQAAERVGKSRPAVANSLRLLNLPAPLRDKVSRAQRYLPRDCDPPTVSKADADATPILMVTIQSAKRSLLELSEIADLTVKEQLQTISDVSSVEIWGEKRYSMRLWLDPAKMAGYGITPMDIKSALDRENIELPSGSIEGNTTELTIRTMGLMHTTEEFNNLVVRTEAGRIIRLSDVGRAELGPQDMRSYMKMNGVPMVGVVVIPQPGATTSTSPTRSTTACRPCARTFRPTSSPATDSTTRASSAPRSTRCDRPSTRPSSWSSSSSSSSCATGA